MEKMPGRWDGQKWVCDDQPADKLNTFYYCCPSGWKSKSTGQIQSIRTAGRVKLGQMKCAEGSDIQTCGPKPEGLVKCCPQVHQWVPETTECPIPEARSGFDIPFLQTLRLPGKAEAGLGKKLALIGIPLTLIVIGLIYAISIN